MFKIFIDTEFTDFFNIHLISIGLVTDAGEEFYAEVPFPDSACSAFVREAVIPLLVRIPNSTCDSSELPGRLLSWLKIVKQRGLDIAICFDYQSDWDLFADALDNSVPTWCHPKYIGNNISELLLFDFHKKNNLPRHHALYDARANRYAYRESINL